MDVLTAGDTVRTRFLLFGSALQWLVRRYIILLMTLSDSSLLNPRGR